MPAPTKDLQPEGNGTVTQSPDPHWHNNQTVVVLAQETWMSTSKGVYIGISVTILALLVMFVVFWIRRRYFCLGSKAELLRVIPLKDSPIGALNNATLKPIQEEDNVYVTEDLSPGSRF
ncbi:hypothetical protein MJG53_007760 [Ovis ammon polii x Ovis aries]|uniref:Uncharacterized protein n=2 Tax=Ovis TaxID=9935 RepID=A0A836AGY3_SHEEP|nr:hypothetical protein JEQ12_017013 [Ovis aries]KAI4584481.1 hypothetical protein MJG53_007760 [Ovis ammon polii x Ovis aries]